jgi:4-hydroxyphenylpyruvate dioxygenase
VAALRERGVAFLDVPDTYYDSLPSRVGPIDEDLDQIRKHRILVDRDESGYLLQIFTKPVQDRPTLGSSSARGPGFARFQALFESIEREQARRGNL